MLASFPRSFVKSDCVSLCLCVCVFRICLAVVNGGVGRKEVRLEIVLCVCVLSAFGAIDLAKAFDAFPHTQSNLY